MTLANAAATRVRLIVWCLPFGEPRLRRASRLRGEPDGFAGCRECRYQVELDPAEMAGRYSPETPVPDWRKRLFPVREPRYRYGGDRRATLNEETPVGETGVS